MELVEGPTLTERIATGALPPNEAIKLRPDGGFRMGLAF
jgi:hypothetical protein